MTAYCNSFYYLYNENTIFEMNKLLLLVLAITFMFGQTSEAQSTLKTNDFYDTDKVREIRVRFQQKNWPEVLDSLRIYGNGHMICDIWVDAKKYQNAGIRYRGSRSFKVGSKRNAFHIKLDYINKNQNHQGFETIKLSNALRDPSMIREVLGYEIARKYMHAPQANHARLYINDEYYGLFVNVQAVDDKFLNDSFGSDENTFLKCSPSLDDGKNRQGCKNNVYASLEHEKDPSCYLSNYELKSKEGWDDLIELTDVLNNKTNEIDQYLDVDQILWMLAYNNVLVNLSSYSGQYSQNYYLYKDNHGKFNPILWDLNLAFGSFKNTGQGSDLDITGLQQMDPLLHAGSVSKPLIKKLLAKPAYKKIYLSHLRTILFDNFVNGEYEARAKELQRNILVPFTNDRFKFYTINDFNQSLTKTIGKRSKIPGIVELMSKRAKFLKKHKEISYVPPVVTEVSVMNRAKFQKKNINTFNIQAKVEKHAKTVKIRYRFDKSEKFMEVAMLDDGKNNDSKRGDGIFGANIQPKSAKSTTIEYYILAENATSISFYPSNYMFEPISSNIKDLNN